MVLFGSRELGLYPPKACVIGSNLASNLVPPGRRVLNDAQVLLHPGELVLPDIVDPLDEFVLVRVGVSFALWVLAHHVTAQQELGVVVPQAVDALESRNAVVGRSMGRPKAYSEDTAQRIDEEVKRIVSRGYDAARAILEANLPVLHAIAGGLMDHESLDRSEFEEIVDTAGPCLPDGLGWMGA